MSIDPRAGRPGYDHPDEPAGIEAIPLAERGLPATSCELRRCTAEQWPERTAPTVLPDAASWRSSRSRTHTELLADVHRTADALHRLGVRRHDTVAGRAKDLILRGGHNIAPRVVEDALLSHPAVTGAQAVGQPDRRAGEVPVAYVTLADATVTADDLRAWAAAHVSEAAAAPRAVRILDALPVTAVGKPSKLPLRADATRRVLTDVLRGIDDVEEIRAAADSGTVQVIVILRARATVPGRRPTRRRSSARPRRSTSNGGTTASPAGPPISLRKCAGATRS
ncbi:hypothetical protein [Streptomyces sp. NPDC008240]|uniref:AMP-binding enzyme n=1 Tax=Streptomyces sp. NPDC008240 TaxID=3364822 RepID=UPI0036EA9B75